MLLSLYINTICHLIFCRRGRWCRLGIRWVGWWWSKLIYLIIIICYNFQQVISLEKTFIVFVKGYFYWNIQQYKYSSYKNRVQCEITHHRIFLIYLLNFKCKTENVHMDETSCWQCNSLNVFLETCIKVVIYNLFRIMI